MGKYIPQHALDNLKKYSYKGVDKSIVSKYLLNPFWTWFVTLWPLSVAPNTITLTGLSLVIINFLTMVYYDPLYLTEKGGVDVPGWVYFSWALGLFLYQSLDAIDGKQARRTGMAGPLGEMFDHGCDAMNTTLEVVLTCQALNVGRSWWTVVSQVATLCNFYLTTWEEYHTGQLYLGPFSGPVEGILIIVSVYIITGIFGPSIWDTPTYAFLKLDRIPILVEVLPEDVKAFGINKTFMVLSGFGVAFNIISSYKNVLTSTSHCTSKKSNFKPLLLLLPFITSAFIQILWLSHPEWSHSAIINSAVFVPFLCAWGLQFAHMVGRMILAHVTKQEFPKGDWMWIWSIIGAADANLPRYFGGSPIIQSSEHNTALFVWMTLILSFLAYARFCTLVINDITEFLGIACFTVRKKDEKGEWRSVNGKKE